jgi:hypothetical protein
MDKRKLVPGWPENTRTVLSIGWPRSASLEIDGSKRATVVIRTREMFSSMSSNGIPVTSPQPVSADCGPLARQKKTLSPTCTELLCVVRRQSTLVPTPPVSMSRFPSSGTNWNSQYETYASVPPSGGGIMA